MVSDRRGKIPGVSLAVVKFYMEDYKKDFQLTDFDADFYPEPV